MKLNDLRTIIKEKLTTDSVLLDKPSLLSEANFNRVKKKIEEEKVPFVMITAFRGGRSNMKNLQNQKELEGMVRTAGFPWTKMPGSGYQEDPKEPGEEPIDVKENSILIWDEPREDVDESNQDLFNLAKALAESYEQDSFIYGKVLDDGTEKEMIIRAFNQDGSPIQQPWAGPWQSLSVVDSDDVYWSTIGNKKAKLTEMLERYQKMKIKNKLDAMEKQHYLNAINAALALM